MAQTLGHVDDSQRPVLEVLCRVAAEEMTGRLREGVAPEDCGAAFVLGCAWVAARAPSRQSSTKPKQELLKR